MKGFIKAMGLTAVVASSSVMAGEVNQADVNTFTGGDAAVASEVNQNFGALIAAINENAQAISQLQSDLTTLSVSGKTYQILQYGTEIARDSMNGEQTGIKTEEFTFTLNGDGSVDVAGSDHMGEVNYDSNINEFVLEVMGESWSSSQGLSWSTSGNLLTITDSVDPEGGAEFLIAPGARTLIFMDTFTDSSSYFEGELYIGIQKLAP